MSTPFCECEHISHTDDHGEGHAYGAHIEVIPIKLRDMGTWKLCEHCATVCHADNTEVEMTRDEYERAKLIVNDHRRLKGMPIIVGLVPAQISALMAAAEFIIDNGGFPNNEELTEHLRNAFATLVKETQ